MQEKRAGWVGSYETNFREDDNNKFAWQIPNVIGIVKKEELQTHPGTTCRSYRAGTDPHGHMAVKNHSCSRDFGERTEREMDRFVRNIHLVNRVAQEWLSILNQLSYAVSGRRESMKHLMPGTGETIGFQPISWMER